MDYCMLCLEDITTGECIKFQSQKWIQLNILNVIEKHFWKIEHVNSNMGICYLCWQQLSDFHKYHNTIEEIHRRNIKIAKQQQITTWCHVGYENPQNTFNCNVPQKAESGDEIIIDQKLLRPYDIITNNSALNKVHVKDEIIEKSPDSSPNTSNANHFKEGDNTTEVENLLLKPKAKRGRPRKLVNNILQNPKKRGRPKKIRENNEVIKKPNSGKRGRPRKKIKVLDVKSKGKRGRPRKIRVNEHTDCLETPKEVEAPVNSDQSLVQPILLSLPQKADVVIEKQKPKKDFVYKKQFKVIQKRKRKHKALIRNYIATSVRCMSFLKK